MEPLIMNRILQNLMILWHTLEVETDIIQSIFRDPFVNRLISVVCTINAGVHITDCDYYKTLFDERFCDCPYFLYYEIYLLILFLLLTSSCKNFVTAKIIISSLGQMC